MGLDLKQAETYVREHGDALALGRLETLLGGSPNDEAIAKLAEGQNEDGGWPATWSGEQSSLDATCYRLDHAEDLGDAAKDVGNAVKNVAKDVAHDAKSVASDLAEDADDAAHELKESTK